MYYGNQLYTTPRTITVIGEGTVMVTPSIVELRIEVTTFDSEVIKAQEENAEKATQLIRSLLAIDVPRENIQTYNYTIFPRYDYIEGRQIFRGYEITNGLQVRIEDIHQVGRVIDTAVKNGANQVSSIQFKIDPSSVAYQQALHNAVQDAFLKANAIGRSLQLSNQPLPVEVLENLLSSPIKPLEVAAFKSMESTPIEPGQSAIEASVTIKFQF